MSLADVKIQNIVYEEIKLTTPVPTNEYRVGEEFVGIENIGGKCYVLTIVNKGE